MVYLKGFFLTLAFVDFSPDSLAAFLDESLIRKSNDRFFKRSLWSRITSSGLLQFGGVLLDSMVLSSS